MDARKPVWWLFILLGVIALAAFGTLRWAGAIGPDVDNDGHVRINDIVDVVHHYYEDIPTPTPGPPAAIIGGYGGGIQGGQTVFIGLFYGAGTGGPDEVSFQVPLPTSGSISNLYIRLVTPITSSEAYAFTVRRNASDTPVTCTIAALEQSCSNTSDSAFFTAGDLFSLESQPLGSNGPTTSLRWTAVFAPSP